eukprot:PhF_6_TR25668/c0_g5_i2/m.36160
MCSNGAVYVPNPKGKDVHVLSHQQYAPVWGGRYTGCLCLGDVTKNFEGSYTQEDDSYVRTSGKASRPGSKFTVIRMIVLKVVPFSAFPRLVCLWNNDEVTSLETMANHATKEEVFPPPLSLTSTNVLLQTRFFRTVVISQLDVLNALGGVTFPKKEDQVIHVGRMRLAKQENQGILICRLRLTMQPVPPATTIINALHLLPHAACVEFSTCATKNDVEVLSDLLRHAPATLTHIEVRDISKLDEDRLAVLAQPLSVPHRIKLCFGTLPATIINPEIYQQM